MLKGVSEEILGRLFLLPIMLGHGEGVPSWLNHDLFALQLQVKEQ